jgi:hypothetical protein
VATSAEVWRQLFPFLHQQTLVIAIPIHQHSRNVNANFHCSIPLMPSFFALRADSRRDHASTLRRVRFSYLRLLFYGSQTGNGPIACGWPSKPLHDDETAGPSRAARARDGLARRPRSETGRYKTEPESRLSKGRQRLLYRTFQALQKAVRDPGVTKSHIKGISELAW